jgi:dephospho-CoA kinase
MRICLTGGIASGKSTVAKMLAEHGAILVDADQAAREAVEPGSPAWRQLQELLGESFFRADGRLDRRKLRQRIIHDPACRLQVNAIVHPAVLEAMEKRSQSCLQRNPQHIIIVDIPLLFETRLARRCDTILVVYVPRAVQIQRLMARDGVTREEAESSLAMQLPLEDKKQWADLVIDNSGTVEQTRSRVEEVWRELTSGREHAGPAESGFP